MSDADRDYFDRRRQQCLAKAEQARDPVIAEVHRQFAAEYERKLTPPTRSRTSMTAVAPLAMSEAQNHAR